MKKTTKSAGKARRRAVKSRSAPTPAPTMPAADPRDYDAEEDAALARQRANEKLAADRIKYPPETLARRAVKAARALEHAAELRGDVDLRASVGDIGGGVCDRLRAEAEDRRAVELAVMPAPIIRGIGGEVTLAKGEGQRLCQFIETLELPTVTSAAASRARMEQAAGIGDNTLAQALDAAETLGASNSLEKMVAHQVAVLHSVAMKTMKDGAEMVGKRGRGQVRNNSQYDAEEFYNVEGCRLMGAATRMMTACGNLVATLAKIKQGGRQVVTVQHVQVNDGGQAVVAGNVTPEGATGRGEGAGRGE